MNTRGKIADLLRRPNLFWSSLSVLYFVLVTVSHEWVSKVYGQILGHFGRSKMESSVHDGSLVLAVLTAGVCLLLFKGRHSASIRILILWVVMSLLIVAADWILIVTNIERIHYPQYAILALLLRMGFPDDFLAVLLATLAGMLDELIQFIWHPQYAKYLDFNDFVLNALGAIVGVLLFVTLSSRVRPAIANLSKIKVSTFVVTGSILGLAGLGAWMGRIIPYVPGKEDFHVLTRVGDKLAFVLSFINHSDFWMVSEYGRRYHILSPLEGLVVLILLLALYLCLFRFSDNLL